MPDYYNTYDPINVAASYIASAMERLEAMVVFLSLDNNAVSTIMNDLEKALEALNKTDLDELDYDEFMEIIGENSSDDYSDPFKGLDDEAHESEEMRRMLGEMRRMRDEIAALRSGTQQPQQQNDFIQSQQGFSQDGYVPNGYQGYAQQQMSSQQQQYPQTGQGYPMQGQGNMPPDQQGYMQQGFQQQSQTQQQFMQQQQQQQMQANQTPMQTQQQQQPQFGFWYSLLTNLPPEQQMRVAVMSQQEQGVIAQQAFLQLQQAGTVDAAILEKCRPVLLSNPIPYNGPLPPDFQPSHAQRQVLANQQARQEQMIAEQTQANHQQVDQRQQARQAAQAMQAQQQAATQRQAAAQQRGTKAASMPSIEEAAALRDKQDQMNRQQKKRATASGANAAVLPGSSSSAKVATVADDEFDMVHIPFTAAEFDINAEGTTSSMYVECWDKSIGEWDVGTLLSDDTLNVSEFSIYGMLADGTLVDVLWTAADKTVTASVQAAHRIGVLTEATQGTQRQSMVRAGVPDPSAILEEAVARTAAEALSYLTEIDILTITLDIEYAETEYTLFFADKSADIEIEWVQEEGVTAETLGYLILHLSNVLNEYAVLKSGDKKQWIGERHSSTKAAWYHTHKQTYQVDVSKARTGTKMILNLSAISVNEDGQLTIRNFS